MKESRLRKLIREEVSKILKEESLSLDDAIEIGPRSGLYAKFWVDEETGGTKVKIAPGGKPVYIDSKDAEKLANKFGQIARQ
jgi:hypothetical protein